MSLRIPNGARADLALPVNNCEFLWVPIMFAIKRGYNSATFNVTCDVEKEFVNKLKELGYKVKIEEKRFYNEAIVKW